MEESRIMEKCKGHICFVETEYGDYEWYTDGKELYRAPIGNVIDCRTGYRFGRWECSMAHYELFYDVVYRDLGLPNPKVISDWVNIA
jgi:hypothetical protein